MITISAVLAGVLLLCLAALPAAAAATMLPPVGATASGIAQLGAPRVAETPVSQERVVALLGWVDLVQIPIEQSVRGRLPTASAEVPWPGDMAAVRAALLSQAHAPLERLHAAGAIDDADS